MWTERHKINAKMRLELHLSVVGRFANLMKDVSGHFDDNSSHPMANVLYDEQYNLMERYRNFKKFDTVYDYTGHLVRKPQLVAPETVNREWEILEKGSPNTDGIFVRAYEPHTDLLRAVIIGAEGTPYQDGLFFFDMAFPSSYGTPHSQPPSLRYHSAGLQINPYIYKSGEVILSIPRKAANGCLELEKMWYPLSSNMLQLLVSIRDTLLNAHPLLNRSGFDKGSTTSQQLSVLYNENTVIKSLKTMMSIMNKPPMHLEDFVVGHFRTHARRILMACESYIEGRFLAGTKMGLCSMKFKNEVASCMKLLIEAFVRIGANEARDFLHLSVKTSPLPDESDPNNLSNTVVKAKTPLPL